MGMKDGDAGPGMAQAFQEVNYFMKFLFVYI